MINDNVTKHTQEILWKNQMIGQDQWKDDLFPYEDQDNYKRLREIIGEEYCMIDYNNDENENYRVNGGNSGFIELINKLKTHMNIITDCFINDDNLQKRGIYQIRLFLNGMWTLVYVDDLFPIIQIDSKLLLKYCSFILINKQIWPIIIEKALAKVNGGYSYLNRLSPAEMFKQLTSFPIEEYTIDLFKSDFLLNASDHCLMFAYDANNTNDDTFKGTWFSIIQTAHAEINDSNEFLFLINSHSSNANQDSKGDLDSLKQKVSFIEMEEALWISFNEFKKRYSKISLCHLFFDSYVKRVVIDQSKGCFPNVFIFEMLNINQAAFSITPTTSSEVTTFSMIISKISNIDSSILIDSKGYNFTIKDNASHDIVMDCSHGKYMIWISSFQSTQSAYELSVMSKSIFTITPLSQQDDKGKILQEIISQEIEQNNKELIDNKDVSQQYINSFNNSGISYWYLHNPSNDRHYEISICHDLNYKPLSQFNDLILYSNSSLIILLQNNSNQSNTTPSINLNLFNETKVNPNIESKAYHINNLLITQNEFEKINGYYDYKTKPYVYNDNKQVKKSSLKIIDQPSSGELSSEIIESDKDLTKIAFSLSSESEENDEDHQWTIMNYQNAIYLGAITKIDKKKNGKGCLFFAQNYYYIGQWKNDELNGLGTHYINKKKYYEGSFKDGKYDGIGKQYLSEGNTYEGEFIDGFFEGRGSLVFSNGNKYHGCFIKGKEEGYCRLLFANGDVFEGNYSNGKPNKFGIFTYANGNIFKGQFEDGVKKGKGQFTYDKYNVYTGSFDNDQFNGFGVLDFENGDSYEGDFINGERQGKGKFTFEEGDCYEGDFSHNEFEGHGKLSINDTFIYKGTFHKGKFEGQGILSSFTGDVYIGSFSQGIKEGFAMEYLSNGDRYEGIFSQDHYEGLGKFYYEDGNSYEGEFSNGQFEGQGKLIFPNGDRYEGSFIKGSREGQGLFFFNNGNIYEGQFKDEVFDGKGILYKSNGDIIEGNFKNGLLTGKGIFYPNDDLPYDIDMDEKDDIDTDI